MLTRALFNLVENAIKYSPAGSCVSVQVQCHDGRLNCEIIDQGQGISPEELPRLFSQYQRFASAHGNEGLGLGLSMVKALVDRHEGGFFMRVGWG